MTDDERQRMAAAIEQFNREDDYIRAESVRAIRADGARAIEAARLRGADEEEIETLHRIIDRMVVTVDADPRPVQVLYPRFEGERS